jgi:hypothetical protein
MRRRFLILMGLAGLLIPVGCATREPVFWSWPHNKRKLLTVIDGFHEFHKDFDRIIFDMEEYPVEPDYY